MGLSIFFEKRINICSFHKINFLVAFFEDTCGLSSEYDSSFFITIDEVEDLLERCNEVLENHNLASELLPTKKGLFFGNTEYDKHYFEDVEKIKYFLELDLIPEMQKDSSSSFYFTIDY
jgi:hypothetical protein